MCWPTVEKNKAAPRLRRDDKYIGDSPVENELTTGAHQIRVELAGTPEVVFGEPSLARSSNGP